MSNARQHTRSSHRQDGSVREGWSTVRALSASKECPVCGLEFTPIYPSGRVMEERAWGAQKTCSRSCAKKLTNPSSREDVRKKISGTLRAMGHRPVVRGGNGAGMTGPQKALLAALGDGWIAEHVVNVWKGKRVPGVPGHYKIDLANIEMMIALEVDGGSHGPASRKEQDQRKDQFLAGEGWSVFRVTNERAMYLSTISKSADILRTLRAGA